MSFSSDRLSALRRTAQDLMMDTCRVLSLTEEKNDWGESAYSFLEGDEIVCGLRFLSSRELMSLTEVGSIEAEIRLPHGTEVLAKSRIKITRRCGEDLSPPWIFDVVGSPRQGLTATIVSVKTSQK